MKVCLVNVRNCINYSQYGPFFFEHIRKNECVIYNAAEGMEDLNGLYEFLLAEYNRNAFGSKGVKLLFLIPREMKVLDATDYEFYNDINIYMQIVSKLDIFSEIATIYFDSCDERVKGETHRRCHEISSIFYSSDNVFERYLPMCEGNVCEKSVLYEKVEKVSTPHFKAFFEKILADIPDEMEERYKCSLMNIFSSKCAEELPDIIKQYELISPYDIADSITKTIKVIYFIKSLFENERGSVNEYEAFSIEHKKVKEIIATYRKRIERWHSTPFSKNYPSVDNIKCFCGLDNAEEFKFTIDEIVDEQLVKLEIKKNCSVDVAEEVFKKLGSIVEHADDELKKFANKDTEIFLDEKKSYSEISANDISRDKIDQKNRQKELLNALNKYAPIKIAGVTEQIKLEQRLENISKKIENLLLCKKAYTKKAFLLTFAFAVLGVIALYFMAQVSVFVKDNGFAVYVIYSAIISVGFGIMYIVMSNYYKKQIFLLLKASKQEVKDYLEDYKVIAEEFEKNLNNIAEYICYKDFLDKVESIESLRESDIKKYEWHKRKVNEILSNLRHFNDYIFGTSPVEEGQEIDLTDFNHDAEHTEFYQMKIF